MTDKSSAPGPDELTTARLLQLAGEREEIPADIEARVYDRVQREWQVSSKRPDDQKVYRQVRRAWMKGPPGSSRIRWGVPLAVAASAVLAVAVVLQPAPPIAPAAIALADVVRTVRTASSSALPSPGEQVYAGDRLATGADEGISLQLRGDESVRLGRNTVVAFIDEQHLRLEQGRVYADTGAYIYRDGGLLVDTPFGEVTDIGTQFAVAYEGDVLDVAVREGRVDVKSDLEQVVTVAGERTQLTRTGGAVTTTLAPEDNYWNWATRLAPSFDIENKPLYDFLRWAARETGRELVFQDDELRMAAMRTDLHGSVADIEPIEAVRAVLATTHYRFRIEANKLIIER